MSKPLSALKIPATFSQSSNRKAGTELFWPPIKVTMWTEIIRTKRI